METSELEDPASIYYHHDIQPEYHQEDVEVHHEVQYDQNLNQQPQAGGQPQPSPPYHEVQLEATFGNNSANYDQNLNQQPPAGGQPQPSPPYHEFQLEATFGNNSANYDQNLNQQPPAGGQPQPSPPYHQPQQYPPQPSPPYHHPPQYPPQPTQYPPPRPPQRPHHQVHTPPPQFYQPPPPIGTEAWTTGLFDCMEDPNNAVTTALVPCVTFGQIAEVVDDGNTTCATSGLLYGLVAAFSGMPCIVSCTYRTKIRNMYGLVEAPASDCLTHLFCEPCSLCQEYRELHRRGLDPSRGWQGNAAARGMNVRSHMTPPVNHKMI